MTSPTQKDNNKPPAPSLLGIQIMRKSRGEGRAQSKAGDITQALRASGSTGPARPPRAEERESRIQGSTPPQTKIEETKAATPAPPTVSPAPTSSSAPKTENGGLRREDTAKPVAATKAPKSAPTKASAPQSAAPAQSMPAQSTRTESISEKAPEPPARSVLNGIERAREAASRQPKVSGWATQQRRAMPSAARPTDILAYWTGLRRSRRFPTPHDLDARKIAQNWPNSIMLSFAPGTRRLQLDQGFNRTMREHIAAQPNGTPDQIEYSSMMMEWVLGVGRDVAASGAPMQDIDVFPARTGEQKIHLIALPFSGNQISVDQVLCQLAYA